MMLIKIANREDPDQTAASKCFKSSLIWVCAVFKFRSSKIWVWAVCLCLSGRQIVFEILEHLPLVTENIGV